MKQHGATAARRPLQRVVTPEACVITETLLREMIGAQIEERCTYGSTSSCQLRDPLIDRSCFK